MKTKLLSILFFLLPATSHAVEIFTESGTDGREITIAEQVGDAGSFLNLVCIDQKIHIEIIFPGAIDLDDDSVVLLQIDNQPERLVAGFFDKIDATTSVFVGLDRRDEPSAATSDLLKQMAAGNSLYLEILISLKRLNTGQWPDRERQSNRLHRNVHRYESHVLSCYLKALHGFVLFGKKRDHKRLGRLIGPSGKSMRSLNDTAARVFKQRSF
jgi:hypothetical protein